MMAVMMILFYVLACVLLVWTNEYVLFVVRGRFTGDALGRCRGKGYRYFEGRLIPSPSTEETKSDF